MSNKGKRTDENMKYVSPKEMAMPKYDFQENKSGSYTSSNLGRPSDTDADDKAKLKLAVQNLSL